MNNETPIETQVDISTTHNSNTKEKMTMSEINKTLEKDVSLRVSIIGGGNAGNQTIVKGYDAGFPVFAYNTSVKDLSDVVVNEHIPSFLFGDEARGAGKSRAKAKELLRVNGQKLFETPSFIHMIEDSDIVFGVGSTAGGTASGTMPDILNILSQMYPGKIFIYYGILPKIADSIMAQGNTVACMDEINKLPIGCMLDDLSYYEDTPNDKAYEEIGKHIVESIKVIAGKYLKHSGAGMIDENDMQVIVSQRGYMAIYMVNDISPAMLEKKSIQSMVIDKIMNSPSAKIQKDGIIKEMGVIVNCPAEMMETSRTGNYTELTNYVGTPLAIFENYAVTESSHGQIIVILSGMNLPYSRIAECQRIIEKHEEMLKNQKTVTLEAEARKVSFLDECIDKSKIGNNRGAADEETKKNVLGSFFGN